METKKQTAHQKYERLHIHAETDVKEAWDWLKANDYNASKILKNAFMAKVAEIKAKEGK